MRQEKPPFTSLYFSEPPGGWTLSAIKSLWTTIAEIDSSAARTDGGAELTAGGSVFEKTSELSSFAYETWKLEGIAKLLVITWKGDHGSLLVGSHDDHILPMVTDTLRELGCEVASTVPPPRHGPEVLPIEPIVKTSPKKSDVPHAVWLTGEVTLDRLRTFLNYTQQHHPHASLHTKHAWVNDPDALQPAHVRRWWTIYPGGKDSSGTPCETQWAARGCPTGVAVFSPAADEPGAAKFAAFAATCGLHYRPNRVSFYLWRLARFLCVPALWVSRVSARAAARRIGLE